MIASSKFRLIPSCAGQLISETDFLISQLQDRLRGQRFRPSEGDDTRIEYFKVFISALRLKNDLLRDAQLDDLTEKIDDLAAEGKPQESLFDF